MGIVRPSYELACRDSFKGTCDSAPISREFSSSLEYDVATLVLLTLVRIARSSTHAEGGAPPSFSHLESSHSTLSRISTVIGSTNWAQLGCIASAMLCWESC
jgi:hypothetical protein